MTRTLLPPRPLALPASEAQRLLREHYGVDGSDLRLLDSELSSVYRVTVTDAETGDPRDYALKANTFSDDELLASQWRTDAMIRLDEHGVATGATMRTLTGATLCVADTDAGSVIVHVGEWLSGEILESVPATPDLMRSAGRGIARISQLLADWPAPPLTITHPWELTRTLETIDEAVLDIRAAAGDADAVLGMIAEARSRFASVVEPALATLPHQVVHHDLHDANLMADPATGEVTGVLDFGDMVLGPRVAELAVCAAYASRGADDPVAAFIEVARGWGRTVALTPAEVAVLFDGGIGRIAVNLAVWTARSSSDRGEYATARSTKSSRALRLLLDADRDAVQAELGSALLG